MFQLLLKTHLIFLLIPLLALALEPTDPSALCDRFLGDKDKATCLLKVTKDTSIDWYASSACSLQQDDKNFMTCLDEIKGATFNPEVLDLCAKSPEISDDSRISCIRKVKNKDYTRSQIKKCAKANEPTQIESCLFNSGRMPASKEPTAGFQPL